MTQWPNLQGFCADQGYRGTTVRAITTLTNRTIDIATKIKSQWTRQPKRWIVEHSHAWHETNNGTRRTDASPKTMKQNHP
jgi:hypothetical protein